MNSKIIKVKPKAFVDNVNQRQMLLREFIHDRLYGVPDTKKNLQGGYFMHEKH
jgi:hypothetical protein